MTGMNGHADRFRAQLEAIAREHPDVLALPIGHPVVRAALAAIAAQASEFYGGDTRFICTEPHDGTAAVRWCETASSLFFHLITCPHFRAQHIEVHPPVLPAI